jgi:prepilin-type N-terminal cleavage/methylation domain-containing protein
MKLTRNTKRSRGMTLLELTVVILVLLSLISILFIGARAWKKGSDRAASILVIRNVQQAVRSYSNMNGKNAGDADAGLEAAVFGTGKFIEVNPVGNPHPAGTGFTWTAAAGTIPAVGTLYLTVTGTDAADYMPTGYGTAASTTKDW